MTSSNELGHLWKPYCRRYAAEPEDANAAFAWHESREDVPAEHGAESCTETTRAAMRREVAFRETGS